MSICRNHHHNVIRIFHSNRSFHLFVFQMHRQLNEILALMHKLALVALFLKQKPLVRVKVFSLLNAPANLVLPRFYSSFPSISPTYFSPHLLGLLHIIPSNHLLPQSNPHSSMISSLLAYFTLSNGPCSSSGHTYRCSGCSELISNHTLNSFVSSRINS